MADYMDPERERFVDMLAASSPNESDSDLPPPPPPPDEGRVAALNRVKSKITKPAPTSVVDALVAHKRPKTSEIIPSNPALKKALARNLTVPPDDSELPPPPMPLDDGPAIPGRAPPMPSDDHAPVDPWSSDAPNWVFAPPSEDQDILLAKYKASEDKYRAVHGDPYRSRLIAINPDDPPLTMTSDRPAPPAVLPSSAPSGTKIVMGKSGVAEEPKSLGGIPDPDAVPAKAPRRPVSLVETLARGAGVPDYSYITRAGEDAYAALANKKADHFASDRVARIAAEQNALPAKLAAAAAADEDRKRKALESEALVKQRLADAAAKERGPADPTAREAWLLSLTPEQRAALGVGPKADHFAEAEANKDRRAAEALAAKGRSAGRMTPYQQENANRADRNLALRTEDIKMKKEADLAKVMEAYNEPLSIIQEAEALAPGITKGQANIGEMPGTVQMAAARLRPFGVDVGAHIAPENAVKMRSVQDRIATLIGKRESGLNVTPPEYARLQSFIGAGAGATPQQFQDAIQIILRGMHKGLSERVAPYRGNGDLAVYDRYLKKTPGAITPDDPIFEGVRAELGVAAQQPAAAPDVEKVPAPGPTGIKALAKATPVGSTFTADDGRTYRKISATHVEVEE